MKWFPRRSGGGPFSSSSVATAEAPDAPDALGESHPSLALTDLFQRRAFQAESQPRHLHVLDLGPAVGANISFLAEHFPCSVEVVDLMASLQASAGSDAESAVADAIPGQGEAADLVLAWDVFNYLSKEQFRAAGRRLAQRCRPRAMVFAMIVTSAEMSRKPGSYLFTQRAAAPRPAIPTGGRLAPGSVSSGGGGNVRGGIELVYRREPGRRSSPRYRPAEVDGMLSGFSVERSMLLRHGIQEFLLARDGEGTD